MNIENLLANILVFSGGLPSSTEYAVPKPMNKNLKKPSFGMSMRKIESNASKRYLWVLIKVSIVSSKIVIKNYINFKWNIQGRKDN